MPRHRRGWAFESRNGENRHSPVTIAMLEPALLVLLEQKPQHGYTLLADLEKMGMATLHPSVVYRTLREMEELEWIQSDWETDQTQGPPRRVYRLSIQGEKALQNWRYELSKTQNIITHLLLQKNSSEKR